MIAPGMILNKTSEKFISSYRHEDELKIYL